jgi:hypothetical protein
MNIPQKTLLKKFEINGQTTTTDIENTEKDLNTQLPEDYKSFMVKTNGGEGFIGDQYLVLWKIEELATLNKESEVQNYAPTLTLFGTNGGGEALGFDTNQEGEKKIKIVPLIGMSPKTALPVADTFENFLENLAKHSPLFGDQT